MEDNRQFILAALVEVSRDLLEDIALILELNGIGRFRREMRCWIRDWLQRMQFHGQYEALTAELREEDPDTYRNFLRVEPEMFMELLDRLSPKISKTVTWYRKAISPGVRLAITIRHLATGGSYRSLMYGFRVAHNTISSIVKYVCGAVIEEYMDEVERTPSTPEEWSNVAQEFAQRLNFPHILAALDGKHVAIIKPKGGGSLYFDYKGYHSIVPMALVDADYKFPWINVGAEGGCSDAQILNHSDLRQAIETNIIGFPPAAQLPGDDRPMPYYIIADDAFAMKTWFMKPFSKRALDKEERIFNYRLSRARRVVENAFGILANLDVYLVACARRLKS